MAEYLAARRGAAVAGGCHEAVRVHGPDAVSFLDGILSQDLASLPAGSVARSFLLAPQGKLRAILWVLKGAGEVVLVSDAGRGDVVAADLARFKFRVDVTIDDPAPLLTVTGAGTATVLERLGSGVPDGWSDDGGLAGHIPLRRLPRVVLGGREVDSLVAAGAVRAGSIALTAVRIEGGEPVMGVDVDDATIPQEAGDVSEFVSFTKGCYLGQELVARIDSRGRVNRHLRGLQVVENVLPPPGAEVVHGDTGVGVVGSVSESPTLRAPVALAVIRREVEPGETVRLVWPGGETSATVHELPMDEFATP